MRTSLPLATPSLLLSCLLLACGPADPTPGMDAGDPPAEDAGARMDAGMPPDMDSGVPPGEDSGTPPEEDAGPLPEDAGPEPDACPPGGCAPPALLTRPGCHLVSAPDDIEVLPFGEMGTEHGAIVMRFRVESGPWREDVFDRSVLNHNLFHLYRNDSATYRRYLLGLGAQVSPMSPGLARRAIFFARVDLVMGFMSYVSFRANAAWRNDASYEVEIRLDVDAQEQVMTITEGGAPFVTVRGDLPYLDRSLTRSGFYLHLGGEESTGRDVSPVGWSICDVVVTAEP